jgi:hypothetical protein
MHSLCPTDKANKHNLAPKKTPVCFQMATTIGVVTIHSNKGEFILTLINTICLRGKRLGTPNHTSLNSIQNKLPQHLENFIQLCINIMSPR